MFWQDMVFVELIARQKGPHLSNLEAIPTLNILELIAPANRIHVQLEFCGAYFKLYHACLWSPCGIRVSPFFPFVHGYYCLSIFAENLTNVDDAGSCRIKCGQDTGHSRGWDDEKESLHEYVLKWKNQVPLTRPGRSLSTACHARLAQCSHLPTFIWSPKKIARKSRKEDLIGVKHSGNSHMHSRKSIPSLHVISLPQTKDTQLLGGFGRTPGNHS